WDRWDRDEHDMRRRRFIFFFQAEDGIRDLIVTGVQTCALPISAPGQSSCRPPATIRPGAGRRVVRPVHASQQARCRRPGPPRPEIGRASCRERVEISVAAVAIKKKKETTR